MALEPRWPRVHQKHPLIPSKNARACCPICHTTDASIPSATASAAARLFPDHRYDLRARSGWAADGVFADLPDRFDAAPRGGARRGALLLPRAKLCITADSIGLVMVEKMMTSIHVMSWMLF